MTSADLERLLARATPFLDVRAPAEFARGAVPGAINLPLLDDDERRRIGITYKQHGHDAAVALGHRLVSGAVRAAREQAWLEFASDHPDAWIYCWRGGQRSEIAQAWLKKRGVDLPRVPGGFKALRRACLDVLERAPREKFWSVLAGRTGSGKTRLLARVAGGIDLEALARHRGSAFGALETPQPTPVTFDSLLAAAFLQHNGAVLVVEDESRTIGRLALPQGWHEHMQRIPLVLLEAVLEERVANIVFEYVTEPLARGVPAQTLHERYGDALDRIQRRLGGARHAELHVALARGFENGDHERWVERLLVWYYDPMYDHQLEGKRSRLVLRGDAATVHGYLTDLGAEVSGCDRGRAGAH